MNLSHILFCFFTHPPCLVPNKKKSLSLLISLTIIFYLHIKRKLLSLSFIYTDNGYLHNYHIFDTPTIKMIPFIVPTNVSPQLLNKNQNPMSIVKKILKAIKEWTKNNDYSRMAIPHNCSLWCNGTMVITISRCGNAYDPPTECMKLKSMLQ